MARSWTKKLIESEQERIKADFQQKFETSQHKEQLKYILKQIHQLEENGTPLTELQRYIYIVSAHIHLAHLRTRPHYGHHTGLEHAGPHFHRTRPGG